MRYLVRKTIIKAANLGIKLQRHNGSMPPGHNGSRYHKETPTRATCHWSIIFFSAYKITQNKKFFSAGKNCVAYILDPKRKPHKFTYISRIHQGKDMCNGLIGQAWVLEALVNAYQYLELDRTSIRKEIIRLLNVIPFNATKQLWEVIDIDGKNLGIDKTYNHQLWYAVQCFSAAKHLNLSNEIANNALAFFENTNLGNNICIHKSGLISHYIAPTIKNLGLLALPTNMLVRSIDIIEPRYQNSLQKIPLLQTYLKQCLGYQMYNLYAFAFLNEVDSSAVPQRIVTNLDRLMQVINIYQYYRHFSSSGYGYNYNPIGFEIGYIQYSFKENEQMAFDWISKQLDHYFTPELRAVNTDDQNLLLSRVYELYKLI
jgi:hypothetical protein